MPNFHNNEISGAPQRDSLHLFIVSEKATSATLNIWNIYQEQETITFQIPEDDVFHFSRSYLLYELATGSNIDGKQRLGVSHSGRPQLVSWHLETDEKVGAITLNSAQYTADAAMLFPQESLGEHYVVSTYVTDDGNTDNAKTNSQFCVVATEDDTEIEINYSNSWGLNSRTVTLNKHQVYLSQEYFVNNYDQSGTEIISNKKIAVFGSHERAKVPFNTNNNSRDHLVEQLPPVDTWSNKYFVVTFFKEFEGQDDIFRVVAALDNTRIELNGQEVVTLNKGDVYTLDIIDPIYVTSNNPILVSQIKKSSSIGNNFQSSDPFLVIVPPQKNFTTDFTFVSFDTEQDLGNSKIRSYTSHYLTIIAANDHSGFINLDGNQIELDFLPIADSDHQYAEIEINEGKHNLRSDTKIGLYVYGYGNVDSYGYLGGMNFEKFDIYSPELAYISDCFEVNGSFSDTLSEEGRIETIELLEDENIELIRAGDNFSLRLIDPKKDGQAIVKATDNSDLTNESPLFELDGFTYEIENFTEESYSHALVVGKTECRDFNIRNSSDRPKTINNITIDGDPLDFQLSENLPKLLEPDEVINVTICFERTSQGDFSSRLIIEDDCYSESILEIDHIYRIDQRSPNAQIQVSECPGDFEVFADELREFDIGMDEARILDEDNVETLELRFDDSTAYYRGRVIDRKQDAFFRIEFTDKDGNNTVIGRNFPGFTLEFGNVEELKEPLIAYVNESKCVQIELRNYGKYKKEINNIYFENNTDFSIPQNVIPFNLAPGETKLIPICFLKKEAINEIEDELIIATDCDIMTLPVFGDVVYTNYNTNSRCELRVGYISANESEPFIENISPNPVTEDFSVIFAVNMDDTYQVNITNSSGEVLISEKITAKKGINKIKLTSNILNTGYYQLSISNGSIYLNSEFIKRE